MKKWIAIIVVILIFFSFNLMSQAEKDKKIEAFKIEAEECINAEKFEDALIPLEAALEIREEEEIKKIYDETRKTIRTLEMIKISGENYERALIEIENEEYGDALRFLKKVITIDEENYDIAQEKIVEVNHIKAVENLEIAKGYYKNKEYMDAYSSLNKALDCESSLEEALELKDTYKAKSEKEQNERQKVIDKSKMESYESAYGPISIAATVKTTNTFNDGYSTHYSTDGKGWFVWVGVNAANNGTETSHVNPNYFTLSTPNGYTTNVSTLTYSKSNYFDATDLRPNTYSTGWLIFFIPKADYYTLSYDSLDSFVEKKIVY